MADQVILDSETVGVTPLDVPGATPGGIGRRVLNLEPKLGQTAIIIEMQPGSRIPAHFHKKGSETHYLIEGDLIEKGVSLAPGAFLTHAAGVVHGPHETKNGCSILTIQEAYVDPADPDFYIAE